MNKLTTRRTFLKQTAVGAAPMGVPLIIPSSALGADCAVAPSNKITIGCIGVGGMGTGNMQVFLGLPDVPRGGRVRHLRRPPQTSQGRRRPAIRRQGLRHVRRLPRADRPQGHRRRDDRRAGPLARPDRHGGGQGAARTCTARSRWACRSRRARASATRFAHRRTRVPDRHLAALAGQVPAGLRAGPQRLRRQDPHRARWPARARKYRPSYKGSLDPQPVPAGFDWKMWRGPAPDKPYNPGRVAWPDWYLIWDYCAGFIANWGVHHLDIANWGCPQIGTEPFEVECKATYRKEGFTDNVDSVGCDVHLRQRPEDDLHRHAAAEDRAARSSATRAGSTSTAPASGPSPSRCSR